MFGELAQGIPSRLNPASNNYIAYCTADTSFGTSYVDVTGCSLVLTPGIWFISASVSFSNTGLVHTLLTKIYYGSTDLFVNNQALAGGFNTSNTTHYIATITSNVTVKIAAKADQASGNAIDQYGSTVASGGVNIPGTCLSAFQIG